MRKTTPNSVLPMPHTYSALAAALLTLTTARAADADLLHLDFEDGRSPADLPTLSLSGSVEATLVPGADDEGASLRINTTEPSGFCQMDLVRPLTIRKNLVLEFDHREEIEEGFEGAYLGVSIYAPDSKQMFWACDTFSPEWRHAFIVLPALKGSFGFDMRPGLPIGRIQLYGRVKEKTAKKGETRCRLTVWFDNIRIHTPEALAQPQVGKPYVCHNNPPLFDWREPSEPGRRIQYSMDPSFPDNTTTTVVLPGPRPFFVPRRPLQPGTWYLRTETETELIHGWSPVQPVQVPDKTHNYHLRPIDFLRLRVAPRPRLLPRIRPTLAPVSDTEKQSLIKQAESAARQGVPEHPGPYREGDPRWPQWIDWYGQVADHVTSRTGSVLYRAGRAAILSQDAEAINAARDLLLAACDWAPDGGSSARYGDLQAASLLKGMLWCYDACEHALTEDDLAKAREMIRVRTLQFYAHLNPFRMNPAQNHPWKKAAITAESALVMMGVFPEAEEWLDTACHGFAYRILPSMGFEGENQEGISYWSYGVNMLANFADLMLLMAGVSLYDHPWLARTCRFPVYCAPPGAYAVSFADNSSRGNASICGPYGTSLTGWLGERTRDPYALWYANRHTPDTLPRPPADIPQSVFYPHIGYALFNTCLSDGLENVAVGIRCGPYYAGHQHDDNNGFVIHAYGDKLAVDGGYYDWYGSPHFKAYSIKTLAHNTLLVDGECQKRQSNGRIADYFDSPAFGWTVGDASNPEIYDGRLKRFDRRILFLKPGFVLVHDLVEAAATPSRFDWLLHAHTDQPFAADAATFRIERPQASLHGRFLAPRNLSLSVTKSFDIPPQKPRASVFLPWDEVQPEWTLTATPPQPTQAEEFLAVMEIRRADANATQDAMAQRIETDNALGCELRTPFGTYVALLRKRAGTGLLEAEGICTDGDAVAVLLADNGDLLNAFASKATRVHVHGKRLLRNRTPRNWALDEGNSPERLKARLQLDDRRLRLEGRRHALPDGDIGVWWANLPAGTRRRCDLRVVGWTGTRPPRVRLGGRVIAGAEEEVVFGPGESCLTVTGSGDFERIELRSRTYHTVDAAEMPKTVSIESGDIAIETDHPTAESERKGRIMEKVAATGGTAYCCIDGPMQWAEWSFKTKAEGDYQLLIRGASEHALVTREFRLDGLPFPAEGVAVRMPGTGGWCRQADDWGWYRVQNAGGQPAVVHLSPGDHVLRMDFVDGSQNVDVFVLRPAGTDKH